MSSIQHIAGGEVPPWTFGERVRKARRHAGLSQGELAAKVDVKTNVLSNWESDANGPRDIVKVSKRIALATGFPQAWLVLGDGYKGPNGPSDVGVSDSAWYLQGAEDEAPIYELRPTG